MFLRGRPGFSNPEVTVFDDPGHEDMFLGKPVEVKVDADLQRVYVFLKVPGWDVAVTNGLGEVIADELKPWPD